MRKLLFILAIVGIVFTIHSCKKTDGINPLADIKNLSKGTYLTFAEQTNLNLNYATIATSTVSIKVSQYLTPGTTSDGDGDIDKIKVYVVKGSNSDPTSWKLVKTVPYTAASTVLSATGAEVATALGTTPSNLAPGGVYTFYNQILTKGGKTYDISNINSNLESNSNYNAAFRWQAFVVCPFVAPVAGTYKVVQDDWQDWSPGDLVKVTDGPGANQVNISQVWPGVPAGGTIVSPLIVTVDPATGAATVPKVTFGNYGGSTNYIAVGAGAGGSAGYIFSCTGYIGLNINITSSAGSNFGTNKLVLQKQ